MINEDAYNKIYKKWQQRSWETWLKGKLIFPFFVKRMEDEDAAYFTDIADHEPFRLGHEMKIVSITEEPCAGKPHAGICERAVR